MRKKMIVMLIILLILFGGIFLYKLIGGIFMKRAIQNMPHFVFVAAQKARCALWTPELSAVGSLSAVRGVNITTELAGMVKDIYFEPGSTVQKDQLLVQLNIDTDLAQLHALQANAALAKATYLRDKAQFAIRAISQQVLETDLANMKALEAQVAQQEAVIAKKTIHAPFSGRLGVRNINLGQYVNPGDNIVTLQTLNPIFIDFFIPQQEITRIKLGQTVEVTSDAYPHHVFTGKITTINPAADVSTRNINIQATIINPKEQLLPGMFAHVKIIIGEATSFITVPQTAISFNPYGDIVYVLYPSQEDKDKNPDKNKDQSQTANKESAKQTVYIAKQRFVVTGETRGEQIKILKGLKIGDLIVTSGQLKLKNGSQAIINNKIQLPNHPNPQLPNDH